VQRPMSMIVPDAEYPTPGGPDWLAAGENQVWTNNRRSDLVVRMDPDTGQTVATVPVKNPCSGLAIAAGTLWAPSCAEGVIYRIDTVTNQVVSKVPVAPANNEGGIAYGAGSIWMPTDKGNAIINLHLATGRINRAGAGPFSITGQCNAMGTRETGFTSGMPGYPFGPQPRSTSTESASTSRSGSSIRVLKSSIESNTSARPRCRSRCGDAAEGFSTAPDGARLPRNARPPG